MTLKQLNLGQKDLQFSLGGNIWIWRLFQMQTQGLLSTKAADSLSVLLKLPFCPGPDRFALFGDFAAKPCAARDREISVANHGPKTDRTL